MKKAHIYIFLMLAVLLFSCKNENLAQYKKSDFNNNRWYKTETITFSFDNKRSQKATITLSLGYVYGSQFPEIPLELYITNPLHQIDKIPVTLRLFDKNKNELGNCMGSLCDITQILVNNYVFDEVGTYKIQVLNTFNHQFLPNINSIGVFVKQKNVTK